MASPRFQLARSFKRIRKTDANITLNGVTWHDIWNGGDLVLSAQVGDEILVLGSGMWNLENVHGYLDVVSLVSAAPVNSWATDGAPDNASEGIMAWRGGADTGRYLPLAGGISRPLLSGDLSSGSVTLRLRGRTSTAANKILVAAPANEFWWMAWNLGPVDPN